MPKVESVNFCSICELAFETRKQFIKHSLSDEHLNSAREEMEDKTMKRVYDSKEEYYFLRPKTKTKNNTKDIIITKPITNSKNKTEDSIYSGIKYECKECHAELRKTALTTHSYRHNRKYLENTEYFDIKSSQNMKEFYITDKAGNYIEDIDEAIIKF